MFEAMLEWLRARRDPLRGEHSAARWAATVSTRDVADIQQRVVETVGAYPAVRRRVLPEHFDALLKVDQRVDATVGELEAQFVEGIDGSPDDETRLWRSVFEVCRVMLAAYQHTFKLASRSSDRRWSTRLPMLLVRLAHYKALDARLRLYRYAKWAASQWREMHQYYELARARRWHHRRLAFGDSRGARELDSIEEIYLRTLLEQRMDSGNFTPDQVAWVAERLPTWAEGIRLESRRSGHPTFFVDPASPAGLRRVAAPIPMARVLYLDTAPLLARMEERLAALEGAVPDASGVGAPGELPPAEERLVLLRLTGLFAGEGLAPVSRAERVADERPVRVAADLGGLVAYLSRVPPGAAAAGTPQSGLVETWRIADRSSTGYRLIAPEGAFARIGSLIGVEDGGRWRVGVVRRMVRLESDELTYGVEIVGHRAAAVSVTVASGEAAGSAGDRSAVQAVYLPAAPENRDPAAKTIVLPDALGRVGAVYELAYGTERYVVRLGRTLEGHGSWSLSLIDAAQQL